MSVFTDTDGSAYVSTATNTNADIAIIKLNSSWTAPDTLVATAFQGQGRETPQITRNGDTYYFFSSKASGWLPSQANYASAGSLAGPWTDLRELGNAATYGTQSTGVSEFGENSYALYGWRWGANWTPAESTGNYPRLLPVSFNAGFASMEYYSTVEYYPGTGLVPVQSGRLVSLNKPVSVSVDGASANNNQGVITDGADLAASGFFRSGNEGAANAYPYDAVIDLGTAHRLTEIDTTTFLYNGSEAAYKYTISGSLDGSDFTKLVDQTNNTRPGYLIDKVNSTASYRYVKLTVTGVTKIKDGGSVTGWGDGLYEVAVFGTPVSTPVPSVPAGRYYAAQTIELTSSDQGAEIHYTLDGSTPTASSTEYTAPIQLTELGDYTLKAVAISDGTVSEVLTAAYSILSGDSPVSVAETPAYAVVPGQTPDLPATIKVNTASGGVVDAPVTWELDGMTFTKPYKSYTIYGTVDGLPGYATGSIETLATQTIYYVDSGTATGSSNSYLGAKWLRGADLLNSASDRAKTNSTTWGYSGQDGVVTEAGAKEVNGLYGKNNAGNNVDYALTLPAGTYTAAFGIYEWWDAPDRQVRATLVDSQGRSIAIAESTAGAINKNNRSTSLSGTFTVPADGAGAVTLRFTNVGWQGATVTWFGIAKGAQTLDLTPDTVTAPVISPTAATIYGTAQQISISAANGTVVYYTTDGSTPSRVNGTKYSAPFTLSASATVSAVAITNGVPSPITAADYTIVVQDGDYTSVPVGAPWFDTDRNSIQAHGGGFLEHDGYYYWVGEDKSHNSASFNGVNLYRSQDLLNWEFITQILKPEAAGLDCNVKGAATCKVERPKLLYNESTDTFVLWGHWETADSYSASEVVVATSSTIDGDYAVSYHGRPGEGVVWDLEQEHAIDATVTAGTYPDFAAAEAAYRAAGNTPNGHQSRDFTVYVDAEDKGWLISAEAHEQLRIYPLTAAYTETDYENSYPLFNGQSREAAAITQVDGVYYLFTSGQSGWYANQLKYAYTTDLSDPDSWSENIKGLLHE
ncbi:FN3 associated domain-containing protein, partial [Microbacterium sp. C448]|uniref:FN3 associated domain-containing protein n=2 Tax=Microbacterium TaxID=33882 RepID=UPI0018F1E8E1